MHRHLDDLCQMQCMAVSLLRNLLAATESISNDQRLCVGAAYSWQQYTFANL